MGKKGLSIPLPAGTEALRSSRTGSLSRLGPGRGAPLLKIYRYPGIRAPLRGVFRNTFLAPSRARREWRALKHLAACGVQPDLALGYREHRRGGFLVAAELLLADFGGEDLAARLARGPLTDRELAGLAGFLRAFTATRLLDPDLWARNLLIHGLRFAKIDASASTLLPQPGPHPRKRGPARAFLRELAAFGLARPALAELAAALAVPPP